MPDVCITLTTSELIFVSSALNIVTTVYGSSDVGDSLSERFAQAVDFALNQDAAIVSAQA